MSMTKTQQTPEVTRFVQGTLPVEGCPPELQNWTQPGPADSETQANCDALIREVLSGLEEEGTAQDRLAGYRRESQGQ